MKLTLKILILGFATMLMAWPAQAEARDRHHHGYRGSYHRGSYHHGGPRFYAGYRSYPRYYARPYYYGPTYYSSSYYDDGYYGSPYYGSRYYVRPAVSISIGGFGGGHYYHHHHH